MDVSARVPLDVSVEPFPLAEANTALDRLRQGRIEGAAVLNMADA